MTLRGRLVVAAALVLAVMLAVGVLLPRTARSSQLQQVDRQLVAAIPIATGLATGLGPPDTNEGQRAPTALSDLYIAAVRSTGRSIVLEPSSTAGRQPTLPPLATAAPPRAVTVGSMEGSGLWRAVLMPVPDGDAVLLAIPLDRVEATTHRMTNATLLAGAAVLLVMLAAGWWLWRLGLRPLAEVTEVADAIAGGDRTRRMSEVTSGTEAGHLAHTFNVMLDEQQAGEERLRQFLADVSHELRTPVAAIGGFADLWREGAIDTDQLSDVMRRIGQESARMRELVEDLLLLARLDQGRPLERRAVDLAPLVADAALDASATHPSRTVEVAAPDPVMVEGDEARLRQVIANIVTNALVHTDPPASVKVEATRNDTTAMLSVADNGPGIIEADAGHAFDRFWRGGRARTKGGSGLGLPLVRSIVEAHGGTVVLETAPGHGTVVRVTIPIQAKLGGQPAASRRRDNSN